MGIKTLLLLMIGVSLAFFLQKSQEVTVKAWKRIALIGLLGLAVVSIIVPDIVDDAAKFVGIGRGADLLLYITVVAFIFVTLNFYVKFRSLATRQDKIISHIAIIEKELNDDK